MTARAAQFGLARRRAAGSVRTALAYVALTLLPAMSALPGCTAPLAGGPPLEAVASVDVERYMGKWYEIARYPTSFQDGCYAVTAEYALRDNGTVSVLNTCREADGRTIKSRIEGFAAVADKTTNAKLTVYFFYPFGAPYWIIDLDEDYQYAVVGEPTRRFLWILSRTPVLDPAIYEGILQRLPEKGYDPARLELTPQFPEEM
jgi:apolipoprotein D and lipocalin family protein